MNIHQVKKPARRINYKFLRSLGIKSYGEDNLYPQRLRDLINSSRNGRTCVERRASYIEANGITPEEVGVFQVNSGGDTLNDLVHLIAEDVAYYDGLAIHVNYTIEGKISSISHVPFECCRLAEEIEGGGVPAIFTHVDWSGQTSQGGKVIPVNSTTVARYHTFDARPEVVLREIEEAGGVENYNGQILYLSRAGRNTYPLPLADAILTDLSTDEALSNVNYRNARNNFMPAGAFVVKRGLNANESNSSMADDLATFQGDTNLGKLLIFEVETEEDMPKWMPIQGESYDGKFANTSKDVMESIYALFNQEGFARLRSGSVGFSSDILEQVKIEYAEAVVKYQRLIVRALHQILAGADFVEKIEIEPLFRKNETDNNA